MKTNHTRPIPKNRVRNDMCVNNVHDALSTLDAGAEIYGVTKGDFSLTDIIATVISKTKNNAIVLATWTAADKSLQSFADMIRAGRLKDVRLIVDPSFITRKPEICDLMFTLFGPDSVRCAPLHAKFGVMTGGDYPVTIRTSMNLNPNKRIESYEISTCPEMAAFHLQLAEDIFKNFGVPVPGRAMSQSKNTLTPLGAKAKPKLLF